MDSFRTVSEFVSKTKPKLDRSKKSIPHIPIVEGNRGRTEMGVL